jgi:hypothetical protein
MLLADFSVSRQTPLCDLNRNTRKGQPLLRDLNRNTRKGQPLLRGLNRNTRKGQSLLRGLKRNSGKGETPLRGLNRNTRKGQPSLCELSVVLHEGLLVSINSSLSISTVESAIITSKSALFFYVNAAVLLTFVTPFLIYLLCKNHLLLPCV